MVAKCAALAGRRTLPVGAEVLSGADPTKVYVIARVTVSFRRPEGNLVLLRTVYRGDGCLLEPLTVGWLGQERIGELWDMILRGIEAFDEVVLMSGPGDDPHVGTAVAALAPEGVVLHAGAGATVEPGIRIKSQLTWGSTKWEVRPEGSMTPEKEIMSRSSRLEGAPYRAVREVQSLVPEWDIVFDGGAALWMSAMRYGSVEIFTDGSFLAYDRIGRGAAFSPAGSYAATVSSNARCPLSAELDGILCALVMAARVPDVTRVRVRSDSKTAVRYCRAVSEGQDAQRVAPEDAPTRIRRRMMAVERLLEGTGGSVSFSWVRGHNGNEGNEIADRISRLTARRKAAGMDLSGVGDQIRQIVRDESCASKGQLV